MKAITYTTYGSPDVLQLTELEKPTPRDNEVLVRIHATTVTLFDCWMRSCTAPPGFWLPNRIDSGIRKPKQPILGTEFAGEIEAVGAAITRFQPGDQVFGFAAKLGTHAEYLCVSEEALAIKPATISYEEAAAVPQGALTALYFLRKANIQPGQKVLIIGASGGVGNYAVQIAKQFGAEVTGVCSTSKVEMVKSLGADQVIDYTTVVDYADEDVTRNGKTYDVIFDTVGKSPIFRCKRMLKQNGLYLFATFGLPKLVQMLWLSLTSDRKTIIGIMEEKSEDLVFLSELIEAGQLRSIIDRCYPLEQVAEAHEYVETGRKRGHVIVRVTPSQ